MANKFGEGGTVQVMLRLPASVYKRLESHSARRTLPIGTFARMLVVMALDGLDTTQGAQVPYGPHDTTDDNARWDIGRPTSKGADVP